MIFEICQTFIAAAVLYSQWNLRREVRPQTPIADEEDVLKQESSSTESTNRIIAETKHKRFKCTDSGRAEVPARRQRSVRRWEQKGAVALSTGPSLDNDDDDMSVSSVDTAYDPVYESSSEDSSDDKACISTKTGTNLVYVQQSIHEDQRFYCPYKGCDISRTHRPQLYYHIREAHDACFKTRRGASHVFRTPSGEDVTFDENSQDMLGPRETIEVQRAPPKRRKRRKAESSGAKEKAYCPYKGCKLYCDRRNILKHIRNNHNPSLTKRQIGVNYKVVLKTDLGYIIHLDDERCRNTLEPGQSVDTEVVRENFVGNRVPVVISHLRDSD